MAQQQRFPARLGYIAGVLPLITIHISFLVSVAQGYIEGCIPYWTDCASISKAGRYGLAYVLFKGGMIPATVFLGLFWQYCGYWLQALGAKRNRWLATAGWLASLSLLLYTLALGHAGESFQLLRRFGVVMFIGLTFIVQVQIGRTLQQFPAKFSSSVKLLWFSAVILLVGIGSLLLDIYLGSGYDRMEDAFEWWLIVLLITHLLAIARLSAE